MKILQFFFIIIFTQLSIDNDSCGRMPLHVHCTFYNDFVFTRKWQHVNEMFVGYRIFFQEHTKIYRKAENY